MKNYLVCKPGLLCIVYVNLSWKGGNETQLNPAEGL